MKATNVARVRGLSDIIFAGALVLCSLWIVSVLTSGPQKLQDRIRKDGGGLTSPSETFPSERRTVIYKING